MVKTNRSNYESRSCFDISIELLIAFGTDSANAADEGEYRVIMINNFGSQEDVTLLDILGFGGVISGDIEEVETIVHALDIEGRLTQQAFIEEAGTRHRAAYRLCHEIRDAFAIVVSQDGNARLVKWHNGSVTYWDLAAAGVPGF